MEKITKENCQKLSSKAAIGISTDQAKCWSTVFNYCLQNGMEINCDGKNSGIERVIGFLEELTNKPNVIGSFEAEAKDISNGNTAFWTDGVSVDCDYEKHAAFYLKSGKKYRATIEEVK